MAKMIASCAVSVLLGLAAAGCGAPAPPQQVNAVLPGNHPIYGEPRGDCAETNAVVLAQCTQRQEYAKTVRGHWERHWYVTSWRVVRVERGPWPDTSVDFIAYDSWPTPESGILLKAPVAEYYRGALLAFCIDTSQPRPTIVAQEKRSPIPPHGKLHSPPRDFYDRDEGSIYKPVMAAVRQFLVDNRRKLGGYRVLEAYDDRYVVEVLNAEGSEVVTVEKDSYRVRPVEPAYKQGVGPAATRR
jgi:hypothetical protein